MAGPHSRCMVSSLNELPERAPRVSDVVCSHQRCMRLSSTLSQHLVWLVFARVAILVGTSLCFNLHFPVH